MARDRLSKSLARAGVASRRKCEEMIFAGRVKINGEVVTVPQTLVDWDADAISVDEELLTGEERKVYFVLNKPKGYLCTNEDRLGKRRVLTLFENVVEQRIFTVGRLDKDTQGLLIITNDGVFANRVIHPSSNIEKEYIAKTNKEITPEHLACISKGVTIDRTHVRPTAVKKVRRNTVRIVVKEGKKWEVRHLVEAAGLEVLELTRVRIGNLRLGKLAIGKWRKLTEQDRAAIFNE